ncbi:transporter [Affinibrenneria salicis]|uniref:Transporter n=1 Tax=Affinibrenneria salicis TaxID=2590031 RepID=A0A5J5G499_9GAMM|nr:TOBE domain-containing protein [Affinibrenneria salicis]KAA9001869.1 transporter [Affinibrenneria salicis]
MTVSARNQLPGVISAVSDGAVNDEVELTLEGGAKLVAVVTKTSSQALNLATGKDAVAFIKAPWVLLASADSEYAFSARNQFKGAITSLDTGAVNATVVVKTPGGLELTAVITNESVKNMALAIGKEVIALVKASSVILAVKK